MIKIDGPQAIDLLSRVVEGNENFHYRPIRVGYSPRCVYVYDGEPSCGIGKALALAGVPLSTLGEMDSPVRIETSIEYLSKLDGNLFDFVLTPEAVAIFSRFQNSQDQGVVWGDCFHLAVEGAHA